MTRPWGDGELLGFDLVEAPPVEDTERKAILDLLVLSTDDTAEGLAAEDAAWWERDAAGQTAWQRACAAILARAMAVRARVAGYPFSMEEVREIVAGVAADLGSMPASDRTYRSPDDGGVLRFRWLGGAQVCFEGAPELAPWRSMTSGFWRQALWPDTPANRKEGKATDARWIPLPGDEDPERIDPEEAVFVTCHLHGRLLSECGCPLMQEILHPDARTLAKDPALASATASLAGPVDCEHERKVEARGRGSVIGTMTCLDCGLVFMACGPCSEAGGANAAVWHAAPVCPPDAPLARAAQAPAPPKGGAEPDATPQMQSPPGASDAPQNSPAGSDAGKVGAPGAPSTPLRGAMEGTAGELLTTLAARDEGRRVDLLYGDDRGQLHYAVAREPEEATHAGAYHGRRPELADAPAPEWEAPIPETTAKDWMQRGADAMPTVLIVACTNDGTCRASFNITIGKDPLDALREARFRPCPDCARAGRDGGMFVPRLADDPGLADTPAWARLMATRGVVRAYAPTMKGTPCMVCQADVLDDDRTNARNVVCLERHGLVWLADVDCVIAVGILEGGLREDRRTVLAKDSDECCATCQQPFTRGVARILLGPEHGPHYPCHERTLDCTAAQEAARFRAERVAREREEKSASPEDWRKAKPYVLRPRADKRPWKCALCKLEVAPGIEVCMKLDRKIAHGSCQKKEAALMAAEVKA